jgi:tRNA (cmo5U34)-methyltransferase
MSWSDREHAAEWDARATDSPGRERQLELVIEALAAAAPRTVLELGVGSGLVAARVLERLPHARLVGIDGSEAMLDLARPRLEPYGERVELVVGDLRHPEVCGLQEQTFDAAYSVQTLHHLEDPQKSGVFTWLAHRLAPGALFLLRDKVTVPERLFDTYAAMWPALPADAATYARALRAKGDVPATLEDHLSWLRHSGFEVGVPHVEGPYVLLAARL